MLGDEQGPEPDQGAREVLERTLIAAARQAGRCTAVHGTAHDYGSLPEADRADMAFFVDQIRMILPVLGLEFLRHTTPQPAASQKGPPQASAAEAGEEPNPTFRLDMPKYGLVATGREQDGELVVFEGKTAREAWNGPPNHSYETLFNQLCSDGVLVDDGNGRRRFTQDQPFASLSAAAAAVVGRTANGRTSWKVDGTGETYADWQDRQVQAAAHAAEISGAT